MGPSRGGIRFGFLCALLFAIHSGCAEGPRVVARHQGSTAATAENSGIGRSFPESPAPIRPSGVMGVSPLRVAAAGVQDRPRDPAGQATFDDPFDPFATPQDVVEEYDPWEPFNVVMFEVNRKIDRYALKPIAQAYNFVMPDAAQRGVENFFHNLQMPPRLFNNLFQGKVNGAGTELGRFLLNTTVGLAGFIDVAKKLEIDTPDEDFGQTLGAYGVPPGPYLVLPLFPPLTLRDVTGYVVDLALNPINWLVFPLIEIENVPSLVDHEDRTTTTIVQLSARSLFIINDRSLNLETFQGVEEATIDLYSAVRNAYLQKRAKAIEE